MRGVCARFAHGAVAIAITLTRIPPRAQQMHSWASILEFLQRRQGLLEAVVFSGGEATLQHGLKAAQLKRLKCSKVGLHTAGINPKALQRVLPYCDW